MIDLLHNLLQTNEELDIDSLFKPVPPDEWAERRGWIRNPDGTYDCDGNVDLADMSLTKFPVKFGRVTGHFTCSHNHLTSLKGAPREVIGDFWCAYNRLTSLKGAPKIVGGGFYCYDNSLTSLRGAPQKVGRDFYCEYNRLTSLEGAPQEIGGSFYCHSNRLTSLGGAPPIVGGGLYCYNNSISEDELKKTVDRKYLK